MKNLQLCARFSHDHFNMNFVLDVKILRCFPEFLLWCAKSEWLHTEVASQADIGNVNHSQFSVQQLALNSVLCKRGKQHYFNKADEKYFYKPEKASKLLAWEFKTKPIRACLGHFRNQSYKTVEVEHEPQFIKGISVKSSILWSAHILYSQNTIFFFHLFKEHFYWRCLVTMTF